MGGGRAAALTSSQGGSGDTMTLAIYDIQNQFVGKGHHTRWSSLVLFISCLFSTFFLFLQRTRLLSLVGSLMC